MQRLERRLAEVDAAQLDRARLRVVLARQQLRHARLPRTRRAHERNVLAGSQLQRQVVHDGTAVAVAERHPAQRQHSLARQLDRAGTLGDRARHLEQPDDLRERRQALPKLAEPLREPPDRIEQLDQIEDERRDRPDRDLPVPVHRRRRQQHDDQRRRLRQRKEREEPDVHERRTPPRTHLSLATRLVLRHGAILPPERLHHAHAGKSLLQHRERLRNPVANGAVRLARPVMKAPARGDQDRQRHQRDQRQLRRQPDECDDRQDDLQCATRDLDERFTHELVERLHVRRQPRDEHAGPFPLEEAERQRLQLVERRHAQAVEEPLARPRRRAGSARAPRTA